MGRMIKGALPLLAIALNGRVMPPGWAAASWAVLLALNLVLNWRHLRAGNWISWAGTLLLTSFLVNDVLNPSRWLDYHATASFYATFAATGFLSVMLRRPFSTARARLTVPAEFWTQPGFIAINRVISLVWSSAFLLDTVIAMLSPPGTEMTPVLCYGLIIGAMLFTDRYPTLARRRMAARPTAGAMAEVGTALALP